MITVKIKLRSSVGMGNPGSLYFQIRYQTKFFQLATVYKIFPEEWDARNQTILFSSASRNAVLQEIAYDLRRDFSLLCDVAKREAELFVDRSPGEIHNVLKCILSRDNFFFHLNRQIINLHENRKFGTARNYESARRSFSYFLGKEELSFSMFTETLVSSYERWLGKRRVSRNTISFYMRILRSVYNKVVKEELIPQNYPFRKVYTGVERTRKRAVSELTIAKFKGLDLSALPVLSYTRDIFFLACTPGGWLL